MKKNMSFLFTTLLLLTGFLATSQKYKSASDTIKLNKELVAVSNEVANLTARLSIAQNNLPDYTSKVKDAVVDADNSAQKSSDQAYKATNGDLGDAKSAKKKAKKALNDAEDAADAKDDVKDQEKKIDKLTVELQKQQKKLRELEEMRTTIRLMHQ
jgi:chromosome segregation ATPase